MKRTLSTLLLIAIAGLTLAFAACGGGDDDEEMEPTPTETETAATATLEPTATEAAPTATQPAPTATEAPPPPTEPPSGNGNGAPQPAQVNVVAEDLSFSPGVINAPANAPFTLVLDNRDANVSHNIAIFADEAQADAGNALFATPIEAGPVTQTLSVSSLAPGDYFAWCQVHTSIMTATVRVQ